MKEVEGWVAKIRGGLKKEKVKKLMQFVDSEGFMKKFKMKFLINMDSCGLF